MSDTVPASAPCATMRRPKVVFSDLDGTLVHFERHFSPQGALLRDVDRVNGTAVFEHQGQVVSRSKVSTPVDPEPAHSHALSLHPFHRETA